MNNETKRQLEYNGGMQLSELMSVLHLSTKEEFVIWANEMIGIDKDDNFIDETFSTVYPYMGTAEEGMYEGQPIVWDGSFYVEGDTLYYAGTEGAMGYGKCIKRSVTVNDTMLAA